LERVERTDDEEELGAGEELVVFWNWSLGVHLDERLA
jgi:hypothetical protein